MIHYYSIITRHEEFIYRFDETTNVVEFRMAPDWKMICPSGMTGKTFKRLVMIDERLSCEELDDMMGSQVRVKIKITKEEANKICKEWYYNNNNE